MSTLPLPSSAPAAIIRMTSSSSLTSVSMKVTSCPCPASSEVTCLPASASRSASSRVAPCAAITCAVALAMPCAAPVTITVLPTSCGASSHAWAHTYGAPGRARDGQSTQQKENPASTRDEKFAGTARWQATEEKEPEGESPRCSKERTPQKKREKKRNRQCGKKTKSGAGEGGERKGREM